MNIRKETKRIIKNVANKPIDFKEKILLSSIEILTIVAELEKKFGIIIDDKKIFREIFLNYETLFEYIENSLYYKGS